MRGGLKAVETELGIRRPSEVEELTGYDATVLWAKNLRGDRHALPQLIQYNTEDVVHLKAIMEVAYDRLSRETAQFLKGSLGLVFKGISDLPKVRRRGFRSAP